MNILVTGGLGFIGSHFIQYLLNNGIRHHHVWNLDSMGYGSNMQNLPGYEKHSRYTLVKADINNISEIIKDMPIDCIVNIAAETHVDRSIANPKPFLLTNCQGTFELLEFVRKNDISKFIQVSTDEVYGEARGSYSFKETDSINPSNPYSASKAAADLLVKSYFRTYGLNTVITRCGNNFGPNQYPEKLIPKAIIRMLRNLPVFLYGNGKQVRDWIYVTNHVKAIYAVMLKGRSGEIYNISRSDLMTNLELVRKISSLVKRMTGKVTPIRFVEDRPGHDKRYSIDSKKIIEELRWVPEVSFDEGLIQTVSWYVKNQSWWAPLVDSSIMHSKPWQGDEVKKDNN